MSKKIVYTIGFIGSLVSIFGFFLLFLPRDEKKIVPTQIQSGLNNIQAGRDVIVNKGGNNARDDGIFLYEDKIDEVYWNEWWAHPLVSSETIKKYGQAELTITGEGKTVDFSGVISMNCGNGKFFWKTAANFQSPILSEEEISAIVPDQVRSNIYKVFCRER